MTILFNTLFFLMLTLCSVVVMPVQAHEGHTRYQADRIAVSLAADAAGNLWRVSVKKGFVYVDSSTDMGKHFDKPEKVNQKAMKVAARGEARPSIAIAPNGNIYVTWTQALRKRFTGYVWFSRSIDGGKTFEKPYLVHQDKAMITHRFDALHVAPSGDITVVWVDKRDLHAAKQAGKKYKGAAIYYAISTNHGESFLPEQKLADNSCECCRIALVSRPDGKVVAMWRHIFDNNERDHAIAVIEPNQAPSIIRASYGHWQLDGCPHHGGAIAYGEGFGYHLAYFDGGGKKPGLKYARMDGEAWVSSAPKKFGDAKKRAGHPSVYSIGDQVWLAWRESGKASATEIWSMHSTDGGRTWADAKQWMTIEGKADYPQMIAIQDSVYLVVNRHKHGLKVTKLH